MAFFSMFSSRQRAVQEDGSFTAEAHRFLANLFQSAGGGGQVSAITVGASPFIYTAAVAGFVIVSGGTVSAIAFSRDGGTTWISMGVTAGQFLLKVQDELRVTYTVAPTMNFVPC